MTPLLLVLSKIYIFKAAKSLGRLSTASKNKGYICLSVSFIIICTRVSCLQFPLLNFNFSFQWNFSSTSLLIILDTAVFLPPIPEGGKQGRVLLRVHYKQEQSRIKHSDEFFISTQLKTVPLLRVNSDVRIFQIVCYGIQNLQEQVSAQSPEIRRFCNLQWEKGENKCVSYLIAHTRETSREMSRKMSCL